MYRDRGLPEEKGVVIAVGPIQEISLIIRG